jgi:hypothetical protein
MSKMIDGKKYSWTQPMCEGCYVSWIGPNPHRIMKWFHETERCCNCNKETREGIYIRVDPEGVPYPTEEKE